MEQNSEDDWILTENELPPFNDYYFVCNDRKNGLIGTCFYDGYGFIYQHAYRNPTYWKYIKKLEKKYGVQNGTEK